MHVGKCPLKLSNPVVSPSRAECAHLQVANKIPAVPYWSPFSDIQSEYNLSPENGATLLDVWVGHNLSMVIRALGPLSSLTAAAATTIPEITLGSTFGATEGLRSVPAQSPDQYAIAGTFADSGALFSGTWRALSAMPSGGSGLIWLIDGTAGHARVEFAHPLGGFPHIVCPDKLVLNGEEIDLGAENDAGGPMTARAWAAYANGSTGEWPTLTDAVVLRQHIESIKQSLSLGKKIDVSAL